MAIAKAIIKPGVTISNPITEFNEDLQIELHGWKEYEDIIELEIIGYVDKYQIPLWCIEGKPIKIYSESDFTNGFFQILLNNGGPTGNIGLLVQYEPCHKHLLIYIDLTNNSPRVFGVSVRTDIPRDISKALQRVEETRNVRVLKRNNEAYFISTEETDNQPVKKEAGNIQNSSNFISSSKSANVLDSLVQHRSSTPFERAARQQSVGKGDIYRMPINNNTSINPLIKQESSEFIQESNDLAISSNDESDRNRQLFKQVILASFRLRGLSPGNFSDYRALYQHTHRSLDFAFRNILNGRMELGQVQDKVDRLLSVYLD